MFVEECPPKITSHWNVVIQLQVPSLTCLGDRTGMAEVPSSETMENSQGLTGSASFPLGLPPVLCERAAALFFSKAGRPSSGGLPAPPLLRSVLPGATDFALELDECTLIVS